MKKLLTTFLIFYSLISQGQDLTPPLRYIGIPNSNYRFDDGLQIDGTLYPKGGIWIPTIITLGGVGDSVLSKNQTTGMVELIPQGSISLTNGEATTANGTAVDLGGTHTGSVNIVSGGGGANFSIDNIGQTGVSFGDVTDNNAGAILHLASFQAYWDGITNHNNTFGINKAPDNNVALDVLGTASTFTSGTNNGMKFKVGGWLSSQQGFDSTRYDVIGGNNYTIFTNNILIGDSAGYNIPTFTTAVDDSMTGHNNIFIGRWAGKNAIKPFANIFIGNAAGMNTIGEWNFALQTPFGSGYENVFIGNYSGERNTTGFENTALGTGSMRKNTIGIDNVALGLAALHENTIGINNTAVGVNAGFSNTTGTNNTAVGFEALRNSTTTINCTAMGSLSLGNPNGGQGNTAIGAVALNNMVNAIEYNTALGIASGNQSGGNNCLYLGAYAGFFNTTINNSLFIENNPALSVSITEDTTKSLVFGIMNFNPATSRFRINATLFIANGDQGAGKILTCTDANGRATWQTPPTTTSGVWTPTLFNVTNIAASTPYECQYLRVDSTVTCSGKVDIDVTLGAASELGMSLPIASALAAEENLGGTASSPAAASLVSAVRADVTNDRAAFVFTAVSLTNDSYFFEFTYRIK